MNLRHRHALSPTSGQPNQYRLCTEEELSISGVMVVCSVVVFEVICKIGAIAIIDALTLGRVARG